MILHEHMVKTRMLEPNYPNQNQAKPECLYNRIKMSYVNHKLQLVYASTGWLSTVANTIQTCLRVSLQPLTSMEISTRHTIPFTYLAL